MKRTAIPCALVALSALVVAISLRVGALCRLSTAGKVIPDAGWA